MKLYIDPGTGSMLFSLAVGLISVIWFGARKLYMKVKYLTPGKRETYNNSIPLVIFSDNKRYWKNFEPIVRELNSRGIDMVYMTASEDDPGLSSSYLHLRGQFIGTGNKPFAKMNFLNATIVLATTPGLDVYQWKRSKDVKWYVHMQHGANEMTTYRMFGIDFYDALLVSGQYQIDDTRSLEKLRGEETKEMVLVGIPYMDDIVNRLKENPAPPHETTVLVAPSWGESTILRKFGAKIIEVLIATGYHIIIRPHPQSYITEMDMLEPILEKYPESDQLEWNTDLDNFDVMNRSDILISDFSGTIYEFSLAFDKPVICMDTEFDDSPYDAWWLDTPRWSTTAIPRLGQILTADNMENLKTMIDECLNDEKYRDLRHEVSAETWVFPGEGAIRVADYLEDKYHELTGESLRKGYS